jgi:hypothetical protein
MAHGGEGWERTGERRCVAGTRIYLGCAGRGRGRVSEHERPSADGWNSNIIYGWLANMGNKGFQECKQEVTAVSKLR